jgi:hypothetical protein
MPHRLRADYWRERARDVRVQASDIKDPIARRALLGIAENYDQLADQAERLLIMEPEEAVTGSQ